MSENAREEEYEHVELFGRPALFTNFRIDRGTVPEGFYCYDLRGSDRDPGRPATLENLVVVNYAGTVITSAPVTIPKEGLRRLRGREELNSPEFKAELQELVNELRTSGPLKNLSAMYNYCGEHGGQIKGGWRQRNILIPRNMPSA